MTVKKTSDVIFRDIPLTLTPHPVTKQVNYLTNEDAIGQAIKNIVLTNLQERRYHPIFGSDVRASLFENFTPITQYVLRSNIERAIENYEPRAILEEVAVDLNREDANTLRVDVHYRIANQIRTSIISFVVSRVR